MMCTSHKLVASLLTKHMQDLKKEHDIMVRNSTLTIEHMYIAISECTIFKLPYYSGTYVRMLRDIKKCTVFSWLGKEP